MATVYDKDGKPLQCGEADAKLLIASGHFTEKKPAKKSEK